MGQLERTVALVRDLLAPDLLGTYLHGSAVLGGLRPASDLDVLAVTRRSLDDRERQALLQGLLGISGLTATLRPVELTVVALPEIRPWRFPPTGDFLYGEWLHDTLQTGRLPQPAPMPDLALVLTAALAGDHPLTGPPPARLLDPVPHADLVRASLAAVPGLLDDLTDDTRNVLLTLARVWTTVATGEIRSKDTAADWALARLPPEHRPVLAHARDLYRTHHYADETWPHALRTRLRPHVHEVLTHINHLRHDTADSRFVTGERKR
ncbi:aminoglycoside adenylyltransferase family protein [Streptomyces sp. TRM 70351]|uniref:aminoglycoside adenylyltransferase family protein n=1 Tax=Streptomyces sp. TRM 70351 TaxID=3116552 RepID=UPI002E7BD42B|nr:aminoglycoside adenylyltransferase family protein [Streptomyces sp. TRM 70351]MEE1930301.1 aminoglycoside adenylyltransferase family protein [Streptomyces sp. TRM 70351]